MKIDPIAEGAGSMAALARVTGQVFDQKGHAIWARVDPKGRVVEIDNRAYELVTGELLIPLSPLPDNSRWFVLYGWPPSHDPETESVDGPEYVVKADRVERRYWLRPKQRF
jgi:hypothetical protein